MWRELHYSFHTYAKSVQIVIAASDLSELPVLALFTQVVLPLIVVVRIISDVKTSLVMAEAEMANWSAGAASQFGSAE